jgi:hypothetical protein
MHVVAEDLRDELDDAAELPPDYPERRPLTYGACFALGLGITVPCPFATCRHSLLSDEYRAEMLPEADLWERETCSLAVAARGRHEPDELAPLMGHCATTIEKWLRRAQTRLVLRLGCSELVEMSGRGEPFLRRPTVRGYRLQVNETDGLPALVERAWKCGVRVNPPPARRLTRAEAEALFPGRVSTHYGEPRAVPGAVGGTEAPRRVTDEERTRDSRGCSGAPADPQTENPVQTNAKLILVDWKPIW